MQQTPNAARGARRLDARASSAAWGWRAAGMQAPVVTSPHRIARWKDIHRIGVLRVLKMGLRCLYPPPLPAAPPPFSRPQTRASNAPAFFFRLRARAAASRSRSRRSRSLKIFFLGGGGAGAQLGAWTDGGPRRLPPSLSLAVPPFTRRPTFPRDARCRGCRCAAEHDVRLSDRAADGGGADWQIGRLARPARPLPGRAGSMEDGTKLSSGKIDYGRLGVGGSGQHAAAAKQVLGAPRRSAACCSRMPLCDVACLTRWMPHATRASGDACFTRRMPSHDACLTRRMPHTSHASHDACLT
eukprot:364176-Chlamydomonas_euryale.AAC.1